MVVKFLIVIIIYLKAIQYDIFLIYISFTDQSNYYNWTKPVSLNDSLYVAIDMYAHTHSILICIELRIIFNS